jgi:hypothetical protein
MKTQIIVASLAMTWLLGLHPNQAEAQSEEVDSGKAAIRFQQGVDLYREGSYEGALAEFRKAYQLSPSYRVLYNIAQTQYALHDFVGAYKSLIQYVTESKGELSTERLAQVEEMSSKLRERIAHLNITTNVSGADIRVDDVSVGMSPLPGPVPVNVGTRRVTAFKAGSSLVARVLTVAGKETAKVDFHLEEAPIGSSLGVKAVASQASGLSVSQSRTSAAPSRVPLVVATTTTAALAVATGICGYLALGAQQDLKDQVAKYPNTKNNIEDARSKSKHYAYVTDALGAATIVSGGLALYLAISHNADVAKATNSKGDVSIGLAPTVGGMVLHGEF